MLQAAVAGFLVWLAFRFLERGRDRGLDGWVAVAFVLVPAMLTFLIVIAVNMAGLPQWLAAFGLLLYFIVPVLMLRYQFELPWKAACGYAAVVLVIATLVDVVMSLLFAASSGS